MFSPRILIIDDEVETKESLILALTKFGFICDSYDSGIVAIRELLVANQKGMGYNGFIVDPFLHDIDGWNLCKLLQKKYPKIPLLIIPKFKNICLQKTTSSPYTDCIEKPFLTETIVSKIQGYNLQESTSSEVHHIPLSVEPYKTYLLIQMLSHEKSKEIYDTLCKMKNTVTCEAVRGNFQIVLLLQADRREEIQETILEVKKIQGIDVASALPVEKLSFGESLENFLQEYHKMAQEENIFYESNKSYLVIDIEPALAKNIFITLFFTDRVIACDSINKGEKLVVKIYGSDTAQKDKVLEKVKRTEGVLRVRQANIIDLNESA
ncbi:MAG: response regulator [Candidatus Brocadiae bacterium]|nr:response regulator [Candidatus Brocadiia bacterium]